MDTDADGESDSKVDAADVFKGSGVSVGKQQEKQDWESFLHVGTIRVLLVEDDDSTRHVLAALLRNCNYEVIEAANGLEAWKVLEDLTNHVDIVLTEVVMPCFSGIALLGKITSHKTRKNVPVIMMSSNDSMVLVFKCLSKGAADFLVKPIRKNELKNLWQHVWRRSRSSSGSGSRSESGTQTQKSIKSKTTEKGDNCGSGDGEKNGSNGLNMSDGSDDGSGAQSSWTKQAVEVDSSQPMSPFDRVAQSPDSTCALVIRPNTENSGNRRLDITVREGCEPSQPDTISKSKDLVTTVPRKEESESENPIKTLFTPICAKLKSFSELECNTSIKQDVKVQRNPTKEHKGSRAKVTCIFDINDNAANDSKELNIEFSLKRLRGVQGTEAFVQDDRCVLRHSEQSAFSRYKTSSNASKAPREIEGSGIVDNSVEVAKRKSVGGTQARSTEYVVYLSSNGVSNDIDMGSTTNNILEHDSVMKNKSETSSAVKGLYPSTIRPVENNLRFSQPQETDPTRGSHHEPQGQYRHFYNHHPQQLSYNRDDLSLKKLAEDGKPMADNTSASGSNHGSNGHNGTVGTFTESGIGQVEKSGSGEAGGSRSGTGVDECKLASREAALNKFRRKRKERIFMKRVRYENRKKLAEQRPRVRGQFVKQNGTDGPNRGSNE